MKTNLHRFFKHCATLFVLVLLVTNCETDESTPKIIDDSIHHTMNTISLEEFLQTESYNDFKQKTETLKSQKPVAGQQSRTTNAVASEQTFKYSSNKVHETYADGVTAYTVAVEQTGSNNNDYDLNLMLVKQGNIIQSFFVKYPKNGGDILL